MYYKYPRLIVVYWYVCCGQVLWTKDIGAELPPGTTTSSLAHVPELDALCVATSTGELLLLSTDGEDLEEVCRERKTLPMSATCALSYS